MTEIINSKINGVLLGLVVGDLLGEQVEGQASPGLLKKFRPNAKYTDDTEMTLITLQHLLTFKTIKPTTLAIEYAANASFSRKYGGNATRTLKKIINDPDQWETAYKGELEEGSWGNGCLMRISPIALFDLNEDPQILREHLNDCLKMTHKNDEALQCSMEYCLLFKDFFESKTKSVDAKQMIQKIIDRNMNERLISKVKLIKQKIIETESINKYDLLSKFINSELVEHNIRASDTLSLIIAILVYNFKYKQWATTQLLPIIVSFGGDTDTNAAILGSLLGALEGITWIAKDWFDEIENRKQLLEQFKQFTDMLLDKKRIILPFTI